jgi:hypothetical protein
MVLLADLATRLLHLRGHYSDDGVWPRALAIDELSKRTWYFSFHLLSGSVGFEAVLFAIAALVAVALIIGLWTRSATIVSWLMLVSLHTRNAAVLNCGDLLLALFLFWSLFLPLGARWSLDARRCRKEPFCAVFSAASAALLLQVCLVYWFSAAFKWDGVWSGRGDALRYALNLQTVATPLGSALLDYPRLLRVLTWSTLALEGAGPLLVFMPFASWLFRTLAALGFIAFHLVAIQLTFSLGLFPVISAAGWIVFLPAWFWDRILRRPRPANMPVLGAHWAVNLAVSLFFVLVVLWNFRGLNPRCFGALFPQRLTPIMYALRLDQQWSMFASRALASDGWQVVIAQLVDGSQVELLSGGVDYSSGEIERPRRLSDMFPDYRWGKYPLRTSRPSQFSRYKCYADFLKREWNRAHTPERAVAALEIYFMREVNQIPRQSAEPELLYSDIKAQRSEVGDFGDESPF